MVKVLLNAALSFRYLPSVFHVDPMSCISRLLRQFEYMCLCTYIPWWWVYISNKSCKYYLWVTKLFLWCLQLLVPHVAMLLLNMKLRGRCVVHMRSYFHTLIHNLSEFWQSLNWLHLVSYAYGVFIVQSKDTRSFAYWLFSIILHVSTIILDPTILSLVCTINLLRHLCFNCFYEIMQHEYGIELPYFWCQSLN